MLLAGCPIRPAVQVDIDYSKVRGRVLAILDAKDDKYGSCREHFPAGVVFQELVLNSGEGHAVFRLPEEKFLKLWKEPLVQWAQGK